MNPRIPALCLTLVLISGCALQTEAAFLKEVPLNNSTETIPVSDEIRSAVFEMSDELTKDYFNTSPAANQIFSPLSLWYALGVLREGAAGTTLAELDRMMKLKDSFNSSGIIPELSKTLNFVEASKLAKDAGQNTIRLSNGIFFEKKYRKNINNSYLDKAARIWGTESAAVDFTNKLETGQLIRDWVSRKTADFIPDYEATFSSDGSAILNIYNVLYLKDQWIKPFAKLDDQVFKTLTGPVTIPFMGSREVADRYTETPTYQAAAFKGETGIRVWFILPTADGDPLDLIAGLEAILSAGEERFLDFKAPVLDIDGGNLSLKKLLLDKGYPLIFNAGDFSEMLSGMTATVSDIKQQTKLLLDRNGFEAAAVTEINLTKAGSPGDAIPFTLDRPYLLVIEYQDLPLFIARITDPSKK